MTYRIGLVGAGYLAQEALLPAVRDMPGFTVAAVCDPDSQALRAVAGRVERAVLTPREEEFFAVSMNAVHVATPNGLHAHYACRALRQGIATLVDKPLADTVAAGARILKAAEETGLPAMVGYMSKHNACERVVRELIGGGAIGRPLSMTAASLGHRDGDWRNSRAASGLGSLADLAIYPLLTAVEVFGTQPTACRAVAFPAGDRKLTDIYTEATVWFGDRQLHLESSFTQDPGHAVARYTVLGTDGLLQVQGSWAMDGGGTVLLCDRRGRRRVPVRRVNPYAEQYRLLAGCSAGARVPREVGIEQALRDLIVLHALDRSAAAGGQCRMLSGEEALWNW